MYPRGQGECDIDTSQAQPMSLVFSCTCRPLQLRFMDFLPQMRRSFVMVSCPTPVLVPRDDDLLTASSCAVEILCAK